MISINIERKLKQKELIFEKFEQIIRQEKVNIELKHLNMLQIIANERKKWMNTKKQRDGRKSCDQINIMFTQ